MANPPSVESVSVILPVWNGRSFLESAVRSILDQHVPVEILIVDDGSTDGTGELAQSLSGPIRYCPGEHRGLPATRNRGLDQASHDWIAFLDVDDRWLPGKLVDQTGRLQSDPELDFVLGLTQRSWLDSQGAERRGPVELALSFGAGLFRRRVFAQNGRFDESQTFCDDLDWFMRAREAGLKFRIQRRLALLYHRHEGNMTNQLEEGQRGLLSMLKKSLARRRGAGQLALTDLSALYED